MPVLARVNYTNWDNGGKDWASIDDASDFKDEIFKKDETGEKWVSLHFSAEDRRTLGDYKDNQSVWKGSTACIIRKSELHNFINKVKDKSFYGRWFEPAESTIRYTIFLREYCWAPSYIDQNPEPDFVDAIVSIGKKTVEEEMPKISYGNNNLDDASTNGFIGAIHMTMTKEKVKENIYEKIGSLAICCQNYLWEEEFDFSKDKTISIYLPSRYVISSLSLHQGQDGVWLKGNDVACLDSKLVANSNVDGLYIKEKYLKEMLGSEYTIVWIGLGNKNHSFETGIGQSWSEFSSLVYADEKGDIKEIKLFDHSENK